MNWKPLGLLFFAFVFISCIARIPEKFEEFQPNPGEIFSFFGITVVGYFNKKSSNFELNQLEHDSYCYRKEKPQAKIVNKPFVLVFRIYNNANEIDFETQSDTSLGFDSILLPYFSDINLVKIFLLNTKTKKETYLGQYKVLSVAEVENISGLYKNSTCFSTIGIDYLGPYS